MVDRNEKTFSLGYGQVFVPFRLKTCDGGPEHKLNESDVHVINRLNSKKLAKVATGQSGDEGGVSQLGIPSNLRTYTAFLLDFSASNYESGGVTGMIESVFDYVNHFVPKSFLGIRNEVSLVVYGRPDAYEKVLDFTDDESLLTSTLYFLLNSGSRGATDFYEAYIKTIQDVETVDAEFPITERFMAFITDGVQNAGNFQNLRKAALEAKADSSVVVMGIAVKGDYDPQLLRELVSRPEYLFEVDEASHISSKVAYLTNSIEAVMASNFALGVCLPEPTDSAWLTLKLSLGDEEFSWQILNEEVIHNLSVATCLPEHVANPCISKECGDSGLPGLDSCGECTGVDYCAETFTCENDCVELECGPSPHGLDCGACKDPHEICDLGICVDDCLNRNCGTSPAGFDCGQCVGQTEYCSDQGVCVDDCADRNCGVSPEGFRCGECVSQSEFCNENGRCIDDCAGLACGDSPTIGWNCGDCDIGYYCDEGIACRELLTWVDVPGGEYQMGCSPADSDCDSNETPAHTVNIPAFQITQTEGLFAV